jgi:hypothetical protein
MSSIERRSQTGLAAWLTVVEAAGCGDGGGEGEGEAEPERR